MTYEVSIPNLDRLQALYTKAPDITAKELITAINQSTVVLQATAKQFAPIDQGRLWQSILRDPARRTGNLLQGGVGTSVKYAEWQERGTGIYGPARRPIRPKTAKALSFVVNGKRVFVKQVKGVKAVRYMERSLTQNQQRIDGFFEAAAERITTQLGGAS